MRERRRAIRHAALVPLLLAGAAGAAEGDDAPSGARPEAHPPGVAQLELAQAAGVPPAAGSTADGSDAAPPPAGGPAQPAAAPKVEWRLAPIVYGGDVGYEVRVTRNQQQAQALEQLILANVRARSYVWQPWFVQVRGGLGLILNHQHISDTGGAGGQSVDQKPVTVTGNAGLTVFPVSRFPFDASVEVTDSRTSGAFTGVDYTSTRLSLRQSYATLGGGTYMSARYDRSILESESFGRDTLDSFEANLSKAAGYHSVQADAGYSQNQRERTGERSTIERVSLRDTYRPNSLLSVESLAYVNELGYEPGDSGSVASLDTRTAQLTSFATWRPADRSPLYVTGSLRALAVQSDSGASANANESQSYNATLGANYQASPFTRLFGTLAVTENQSTSASALTTTQSAGVSYTPALIPLGPYSYSWSTSANVANRSVSGEGSQQAISGSIGHNLLRGFDISATSRTTLNFAQTLATVYDTDFGDRYTLTNSFNLSWSNAGTPGSSQFASLTVSDSRSWGQVSNDFQLVNLQLTRQSILNRVSSWSGNVTVQGSRQHTEPNPEPGLPASDFPETQTQSLSYSINLTYEHQRALGVRNLRFYALATANSQQVESRQAGDINAPPEFINNSLELRFDYFIGRVLARLSARTAEIGGRRQSQVLFRITRYFGSM